MVAFVLRRLRASAPMLGPFAKIQRRTLRAALGVFGSADSAPRVQVGGAGARPRGGACKGILYFGGGRPKHTPHTPSEAGRQCQPGLQQ
jgi:hypothetical protein